MVKFSTLRAGRAAPARAAPLKATRASEPYTIPVRSVEGADVGSASLALKVASPETARHVVHRYLVMVQQNARQGSANTKTRAEVRGGGAKPYKQKGTGRARQGSTRTPLRPGGGVVFGPKPRDWSIKMNKKERHLAMSTALQSAARDMTVVDDIGGFQEARKTNQLVTKLAAVGVDVMSTYTLLVTGEANATVNLAARNVSRLTVNSADCLQFYDVMRADAIVIEAAALDFLQSKFSGASAPVAEADGPAEAE